MARAFDLSDMGHGLTTEKQLHIAKLVREYDPNLSLRRIPERDPAFQPPRIYGVYEENVGPGQPNWVFTIPESAIDHRVMARIRENDFKRLGGADGAWDKFMALRAAEDEVKRSQFNEMMAEREEEMLGVARLAQSKSSFRHKLNGEDVVIGDTVRRVRGRV